MYDDLLEEARCEHIDVYEYHFRGELRGLYWDRSIGVHKDATTAEKACILAEELGHYHTSVGVLLEQDQLINRKLEKRARRWGYEHLLPLDKIVKAFNAGVRSRQELVEYLEVMEDYLLAALRHYQEKHGQCSRVGEYVIVFEPLMVLREI